MRELKWVKPVTAAALAAILFVLAPLAVHLLAGFYRGFKLLARELAGSVQTVSLLPGAEERREEPVTFLVFGIDAGEWAGGSYRPGTGRADTILLIKAFPATGTASMLSIPRDTLVVIPGYPGDDKINHSYAFGRTALLVETVELFTGVPVDYYIGLNYAAFRDVVDLLGGVEFEVDRVITSRGLRLEKGLQVLDGDQAFALVSTRRDPMGDIARVGRQQRFARAVWQAAGKKPFDELIYILLAAWNNVDTNLTPLQAVELYGALKEIREENVATGIVPGWFYNRGGISYWGPYREQTEQLIKELFFTPEQKGTVAAR